MTGPRMGLEELAALGTATLERVIAIDSQSREASDTIPSSEGQVRLAADLAALFAELGLSSRQDGNANLIVRIPASPGAEGAPPLALMVHMDTAEGTTAVPRLEVVPRWDGGLVRYPQNDRLHVSVEDYPQLAPYVGEDLLHGPGERPVGFDDKLGMAEIVTLAQLLVREPQLAHPEILLVFRPDEEIGRMEAVEGLAQELAAAGVRYGYTVDGLDRFEINAENFNAARAQVRFAGRTGGPRTGLVVRVEGVKTHGATAKAEGHRNATTIVARALASLGWPGDVVPVVWESSREAEVDAVVTFALADAERHALLEALEREVAPHARRGAAITVVGEREVKDGDAVLLALRHIDRFVEEATVHPVLSEHSAGHQGYSNPYAISGDGAAAVVEYRLRDFDEALLEGRIADVRAVAARDPQAASCEAKHQYVNMGPALQPYPELLEWAEEAGRRVGVQTARQPIRGGTGVDPFLAAGIPVANLGTGYFAPESEKELTTRQSLAKHVLWLAALAQVVAGR